MQRAVCPWVLQCFSVWKHWQVLMLQEQRCVCVTTALPGTAAGEASSMVFILPFLSLLLYPFGPWLPAWPSSGNRSVAGRWAGDWQDWEGFPRDAVASVRSSGMLPFVLCAPQSSSQVLGSVPPSGKVWWVGRETDPFLFFPSVYLRKIYLW